MEILYLTLAYMFVASIVFCGCKLTGPNGLSDVKSVAIALTWPVSIPVIYIMEKMGK